MRCKACNSTIQYPNIRRVLVDEVNLLYKNIEEDICNKCIGTTYKDETMDHIIEVVPVQKYLGNGNYETCKTPNPDTLR